MRVYLKRLLLMLTAIGLFACTSNQPATTGETSVAIAGNNDTSYSLDWKLGANEVVGYKTAMNRVEGSNPVVSFNLDQVFSDDANLNALTDQFSNLRLPESSSFISILEPNARGNISVRMILNQINTPENQSTDELSQSFAQAMQAMEGTVQLRGELTPDGSIASFYLEERQRNLLAIFFELPTVPVWIGDQWSLDFNCVTLGTNFIPNTAEKINRVTFTELSQTTDGNPVAVIDYLLIESVDGNFQSLMTNELTPTTMTCSFLGRGRFLVEQGRWEQLVGEFAVTSTGIMTSNAIQQFALEPLTEVPDNYRNSP